MALDFPSSPVDGQVYDNYYWSASTSAWRSLGSKTVPNILSNATFKSLNAGSTAIVVQGSTSQSANLQQWKDASGNVLSSITADGFLQFGQIFEYATVSATAASGTINYDILTNKAVTYFTSAATGNWTLNIRGNGTRTLENTMLIGQSLTIAFLVTNTGTAYRQTGLTIDSVSVTPKWQNGVAPTAGNINAIDIYAITIIKTAPSTWTVLESQTKFA